MTVEEIIKDACLETNTSLKDYGEEKALLDLNKIYRKVWRNVVKVHEEYFWNYWVTDIQEWATEYAIQRKEEENEDWEKIPWIAKVKQVFIKATDDWAYLEIPQLDDYEERKGYKGWYLADNHIILSREPKEDIQDWIKLVGIQSINDLTMEDDEESIFPWHEDLSDFWDVLALGLKQILWRAKQDFDKANLAGQEFELAQEDMRRFVAERVQSIYYTKLDY